MAGFTLYETLRIFLPGALGILVASLTAQLASPGKGGGLFEFVPDATSFIAAATFLGLLLYAIDLPSKTRIARDGDPTRGYRIPSKTLRRLIKEAEEAQGEAGLVSTSQATPINLYTMLADRGLPAEEHRRVYLFGSLYRVFVDLRMMLIASVLFGPMYGIAQAQQRGGIGSAGFDMTAFSSIALIIIAATLLGIVGLRTYARNWLRKHGEESFSGHLARETTAMKAYFLAVLGLSSFAQGAFLIPQDWARLVGIVLGGFAFTMWFWVEMGPPEPKSGENNPMTKEEWRLEVAAARLRGKDQLRNLKWKTNLRDRIMLSLCSSTFNDSQYHPLQRFVADMAVCVPGLIAASLAAFGHDMPPIWTVYWGLLVVPAVAIMTVRKHEQRLLFVYEEQSLWLELHRDEIHKLVHSGQLPEVWRSSS